MLSASTAPAGHKHRAVQADRGNRYKERKNADKLLKRLERASVVIIERGATDPATGRQGWRILEAWRGSGA